MYIFEHIHDISLVRVVSTLIYIISFTTRKKSHVNPQLLQGIRLWQWRWHQANQDFLSLTGHALSKRLQRRQSAEAKIENSIVRK